jgi:hypothetical protein
MFIQATRAERHAPPPRGGSMFVWYVRIAASTGIQLNLPRDAGLEM